MPSKLSLKILDLLHYFFISIKKWCNRSGLLDDVLEGSMLCECMHLYFMHTHNCFIIIYDIFIETPYITYYFFLIFHESVHGWNNGVIEVIFPMTTDMDNNYIRLCIITLWLHISYNIIIFDFIEETRSITSLFTSQ